MENLRVYRVHVKTTNALGNTTTNYWKDRDRAEVAEYFECEDGRLYVVTDDPKKIYDKFSKETIISITDIGVGYVL